MKKLNQKKKIEVREFRKLKKHPRQSDYFNDVSEEKIKAMAADIKARGLDHMIEILPNGTIISGHQRLRALKLLGYKKYKVIVRYDLAGANEFMILNAFLASNAHRRDQDMLAQAKVALGLYEAENGGKVRECFPDETKDARDHIGKMIGKSGRHLQRYWAILRTPREVQEAFREHKLDVTMASKIGCLTDECMNEIAERISQGEDPKVVAKDYLAPPKKREGRVITNGMKNLNLFVEQVGGHAAKLGPPWMQYLPLLKQAQDVIGQIIDRFANADAVNAEFAKNKTESAVPNSSICSK